MYDDEQPNQTNFQWENHSKKLNSMGEQRGYMMKAKGICPVCNHAIYRSKYFNGRHWYHPTCRYSPLYKSEMSGCDICHDKPIVVVLASYQNPNDLGKTISG